MRLLRVHKASKPCSDWNTCSHGSNPVRSSLRGNSGMNRQLGRSSATLFSLHDLHLRLNCKKHLWCAEYGTVRNWGNNAMVGHHINLDRLVYLIEIKYDLNLMWRMTWISCEFLQFFHWQTRHWYHEVPFHYSRHSHENGVHATIIQFRHDKLFPFYFPHLCHTSFELEDMEIHSTSNVETWRSQRSAVLDSM